MSLKSSTLLHTIFTQPWVCVYIRRLSLTLCTTHDTHFVVESNLNSKLLLLLLQNTLSHAKNYLNARFVFTTNFHSCCLIQSHTQTHNHSHIRIMCISVKENLVTCLQASRFFFISWDNVHLWAWIMLVVTFKGNHDTNTRSCIVRCYFALTSF